MALTGENMNLREYLFINRLSVTEFSEKLEYSRTHLSAIIHGKLKPSKRLAKAIEKATNGDVTIQEVLSEYKGKENG